MNIYRVTFAGHRCVKHFFEVEKTLDTMILYLLKTNEFVEFYVGNNGVFDSMAAAAIRRARKKYGEHNSAVYLVMTHGNGSIEILKSQFDAVIIPEIVENVHHKRKIAIRNQWMIDCCDMLICYVETASKGGAAHTLCFALRKSDIKIQNIYPSQ